jgi:LacI family transcriptional regulator
LAGAPYNTRTKTIGLIIPDIANPFYQRIIDPIEEYANRRGFTLFLGCTRFSPEKEESYINAFVTKRVDGVILVTVFEEQQRFHTIFDKYSIPSVLLDRRLKNSSFRAGVFSDNEFSVFKACEYLIRHGKQRLVFLSGPGGLSTAVERYDGYRAALTHYGLTFAPELVLSGNYTIQSGYESIMQLHKTNTKFDAMVASSDTMAIGALAAVKEMGYDVPGQIEIIGFDGIDISDYVSPKLSTIRQPIFEMGKKSAELLFDLIDNVSLKQTNIYMETEMILRGTTRKDDSL